MEWGEVLSVEALRKKEEKGLVFCGAAQVTGPEGKVFSLHSYHPEFGDFLRFLKGRVGPDRFDPFLLRVLEAGNLRVLEERTQQGRVTGLVGGIVLGLGYLGLRSIGVQGVTLYAILLGAALVMALILRAFFSKGARKS